MQSLLRLLLLLNDGGADIAALTGAVYEGRLHARKLIYLFEVRKLFLKLRSEWREVLRCKVASPLERVPELLKTPALSVEKTGLL